MKLLQRGLVFLFVLAGLIACGPFPGSTLPEQGASSPRFEPESSRDLPAGPTPYGWVLEVEGEVSIQRQGSATRFPAEPGVRLRPEDIVTVHAGSYITISCEMEAIIVLEDGFSGKLACEQAEGLPPGTIIRIGRDGVVNYLHEARDIPIYGFVPVLLQPRNTSLVEESPLFRWTPVNGALRYEVAIYASGLEPWTLVVSSTEMLYPDTAPNLVPGKTYQVQIMAYLEDEVSPRTSEEGIFFRLLDEGERDQVREWERNLETLGLEQDTMLLLSVAHSYELKLLSRAREQLEPLLERYPQRATLHLLQGDLYLESDLLLDAEKAYIQATQLALDSGDDLTYADALAGRGIIHFERKQYTEAIDAWQQCLEIYQSLGEPWRADQIEQAIGKARQLEGTLSSPLLAWRGTTAGGH